MAQAKRITKNFERRWIVLATDGRHVTVGRHTDPTEEEIEAAAKGLAAQGLAGWLAVSEGDYWAKRGTMTVMMVKPLADPATAFEDAVAAYEAIRASH